jgi:hypothetical protein
MTQSPAFNADSKDTGPPCADCGVGTTSEWYVVKDDVWERAWINRLRPLSGEILCIGCLETRLGRTLTAHDFTDFPISIPTKHCSKRLRNRLTSGITAEIIKARTPSCPIPGAIEVHARAYFTAAMSEPRCDYCDREDFDGNPIRFVAIGSPNNHVVENACLHRKCERSYLQVVGP